MTAKRKWSVAVFYGSEEEARKTFSEEQQKLLDSGNPDGLWVFLLDPEGNEIMFAPCSVVEVKVVDPGE